MTAWRTQAPLANLRRRADMLAVTRDFFAARDVLEVETPLMCHATATDLHLQSLTVNHSGGAQAYLQTSPEFAMKRLLASGSGPIYQLCKAFRSDELGRRHNPEFSMLEWYRPGFSDHDLMDEVEALMRTLLADHLQFPADMPRITYRAIFQQYLGFDPMALDDAAVCQQARALPGAAALTLSRNEALDLLMSLAIEPHLQAPVFVYQFPATQAALACVKADEDGYLVAHRFEAFMHGMELANGYQELTDAYEQEARFHADNAERREAGLPEIVVDERLLAALRHGLPPSAGVAVGFDRLVMLATGAAHIHEVMSFTADRA